MIRTMLLGIVTACVAELVNYVLTRDPIRPAGPAHGRMGAPPPAHAEQTRGSKGVAARRIPTTQAGSCARSPD